MIDIVAIGNKYDDDGTRGIDLSRNDCMTLNDLTSKRDSRFSVTDFRENALACKRRHINNLKKYQTKQVSK